MSRNEESKMAEQPASPKSSEPQARVAVNSSYQSIIAQDFRNFHGMKFGMAPEIVLSFLISFFSFPNKITEGPSESRGSGKVSRGSNQSISAHDFHVHGDVRLESNTNNTPKSDLSRIREWVSELSPLQWSRQQQKNFQISRKTPGSGGWFLNSSEFREWRDGQSKELMCPGILGVGKTVLSSIVIDHLLSYGQNRDMPCLFIYFDYSDHERQHLGNLTGSLLSQLLRHSTRATGQTKSKYHIWTEEQAMPSSAEQLEMLQSQIALFPRVFIVIDALDECPEEPETNTRSNFLRDLHSLPESTHILYTYRDIGGLGSSIRGGRACPISKLEIFASEENLQNYIQHRIDRSDDLLHIIDRGTQQDRNFRRRVVNTIVKRSGGMFLLAQLHMEFLITQCSTLECFKVGLQNLTGTPAEFYTKAMDRIERQTAGKKQLAFNALTWLVFSRRTMTFSEIQHALAIQTSDKKFVPDRQVTAETLTSACAGIVLVDPDADAVRLAHCTTLAYLREERGYMFQDCHSKLAEQCLTYLSFDEFDPTTWPVDSRQLDHGCKEYPFLSYAANHWGDHMAQGVKQGHVHQLAWKFLSSAPKTESACRVMTDIRFRHDSQISGLHIAAYFGLDMFVKKAISKNSHFLYNAKTARGETALHWAASCNQVQFLRMLVEQGVDLNEADIHGRTALHHAVMCGHLSSTQVLLSSTRRMNLDIPDRHGWTPLRWAAKYGQSKIVEGLLINGADIDAEDSHGWTALRWAASQGQGHIVKQLIQHGASLRRTSKDDWTLLHWAAREGRNTILQMLIEKAAPLNSADDQGYTALRWATDYNRGMTAWLLMAAGADVDAADKKGNTPLHSAVHQRNKFQDNSLVWLLLEHGANINAQNKLGLTASHLAATVGCFSIMWLLLHKGADISRVDNNGRTALHWTVTEGHEGNLQTAKLLMDKTEGLVNVADDQKETVLHVAASQGNLRTVQLLLDYGAELDARDRKGFTPLHRAVYLQQHDVVRHLAAKGADVNIPNRKKWTALHSAAASNNIEDIKTIVESSRASLVRRNDKNQTPWGVGVGCGYKLFLLKQDFD